MAGKKQSVLRALESDPELQKLKKTKTLCLFTVFEKVYSPEVLRAAVLQYDLYYLYTTTYLPLVLMSKMFIIWEQLELIGKNKWPLLLHLSAPERARTEERLLIQMIFFSKINQHTYLECFTNNFLRKKLICTRNVSNINWSSTYLFFFGKKYPKHISSLSEPL